MHKSLVSFPSTISTKYFSNFLGTRDPSCSLSHELCFVFRSSSSQTPATHRTIDAVHSWVIDEGLNLRHLPRTRILGMFMNEVFLHCHLQLVGLYTSSDLWLNSLCFQLADVSCCTRAPQRRKLVTWRTSHKKFRLFSILHPSEFCSVIFKTEVPQRWVLQSSNPLQNLHGVPTSFRLTRTSTD